jgi:hypothetical protein
VHRARNHFDPDDPRPTTRAHLWFCGSACIVSIDGANQCTRISVHQHVLVHHIFYVTHFSIFWSEQKPITCKKLKLKWSVVSCAGTTNLHSFFLVKNLFCTGHKWCILFPKILQVTIILHHISPQIFFLSIAKLQSQNVWTRFQLILAYTQLTYSMLQSQNVRVNKNLFQGVRTNFGLDHVCFWQCQFFFGKKLHALPTRACHSQRNCHHIDYFWKNLSSYKNITWALFIQK